MQQQPPQGPFPPQDSFPPQNPPHGPPMGVMSPHNSGLAVGSLVCSLAGIIPCFFLIPSIVGLILGIIAVRKINRSSGILRGKGKAVAGIIIALAWIVIFPTVVYSVFSSNANSAVADIDTYLKAINSGDYETAYNKMLAPQYRSQVSFEEFVKECKRDRENNGEYQSCSFSLLQGNSIYIHWDIGAGKTMNISVSAQYSQTGNVLRSFTDCII